MLFPTWAWYIWFLCYVFAKLRNIFTRLHVCAFYIKTTSPVSNSMWTNSENFVQIRFILNFLMFWSEKKSTRPNQSIFPSKLWTIASAFCSHLTWQNVNWVSDQQKIIYNHSKPASSDVAQNSIEREKDCLIQFICEWMHLVGHW